MSLNRRDFVAALTGAAVAGVTSGRVAEAAEPQSASLVGSQAHSSLAPGEATGRLQHIFTELYLGDITGEDASQLVRPLVSAAWRKLAPYRVVTERDFRALLLAGKVAKADFARVITAKYVVDIHDLGLSREQDEHEKNWWTQPGAAVVPPATTMESAYIRRISGDVITRLVDILGCSCADLAAEIVNKVAYAKQLADKARAAGKDIRRVATIDYVTEPEFVIRVNGFMLEMYGYVHFVQKL